MGLMELQYEEGQTPLDKDEKDGLSSLRDHKERAR
jgi:hypothetical protein